MTEARSKRRVLPLFFIVKILYMTKITKKRKRLWPRAFNFD